MDPAFSLADELADLHHHSSYHHTNELLGEQDVLQSHPHNGEYAAGTSLADEYHHQGGFGLDAELEGLHLHGNDLASELGGDGAGSLADELDPAYSGGAGGGSLGDELLQHIGEDDDRAAYMSQNASTSDAFTSGTASPTSSSRYSNLSRQSTLLNPPSPSRSSTSTTTTTTTTTTPNPGDATSSTATTISSTLASLAQTAELEETFSATQAFLSHLSSLSTTRNPQRGAAVDATTTTTTKTGEMGEEDTARLEHAAANYLKLVSQSTAEREAQLRELRELDRRFARSLAENNSGGVFGLSSSNSSNSHSYGAELNTFSPDTSSSLALPEVEEDQEESDSFSTHLVSSPTRSLARRRRSTASLASDTTITDIPSSSHPPTTPAIDSTLFAPFYTSTSTLLTSLTSLHEHTQITKSTTADAARKLKTLKGLIQQWRAEMDSVETSELWIQSHQGENADKERQVGGEKGKGGKVWLGEQVDWCQRRIEEVEVRARVLLTPVSLSS